MGEIEVDRRGQAAGLQNPGRSPEPRPDLAHRRRIQPADRASQLDVEPALLPGSRRHVGQHLPGTAGVAPVGRNAVCRGVHRRRHFGPSSVTALRHARMRLRLATVLGQAHGRAVRLCRLDRRIEDEAK